MSERFYVSNNIRFVYGAGELIEFPSSAKHFRHVDAQKYISAHPGCMMIPCKNKKYIISTERKFIGNNNNVVTDMQKAKVFSTPNEAFAYIENYPDIQNCLGNAFVIDNNYKKFKKEYKQTRQIQQDDIKRIQFSPSVRHSVFKKSNHCALCGKELDEIRFSIDHETPLSRGGTNNIDNLRPVCPECNRLKGNFTDEEMMNTISNIGNYVIYSSPFSDLSKSFVRAMVRGTINEYKNKYTLREKCV